MHSAKPQLLGAAGAAGSHPGLGGLRRFAKDRRWLLLAAFASAKLLIFWGKKPHYSGDEQLWEKIGQLSLFDVRFWTANRPFATPLLHKLAGFSHERVVWLQVLIGAAAWATLAFCVSRLVRSKLGSELAFALILALGLATRVHGWDFLIRSEALSNAGLVLLVAATLNLLRCLEDGQRRGAVGWSIAAVLSGVFASFARDSNAYVVVLLLPFLAAAALGLWRKSRSSPGTTRFTLGVLAVTAAALLGTSAAARANAERSERYRWPLTNVIFKRVLPHPERLAYFRDELGMPVSRALLGRKHKQMSSDNWYVRRAPELEHYRTWLLTEAYAGYQRYLLRHPVQTWRQALRLLPKHATDTHERHTRRGSSLVSDALDRALLGTFSRFPWFTIAAATLAALIALGVRDRALRLLGGTTLFAMLVMLTQAYICFHADALEVMRHCLNVGLFFWIGSASGVLVIALLIARVAARQSAAPTPTALAGPPQP